MSTIFISYRRGDSAGHTGRLFDVLRNKFGKASVFRDIDDLEPGVDFVDALDQALVKCDILLVIIGDEWASATGSKGRRLDQPDDFVRMEVAKALERNVRVIPVLVAGATMPNVEELPEDLRALARRNAIELSDTRWDYDVGRLCDTLAKVLGGPDQAVPVGASRHAPAAAPLQDHAVPEKKGGGMLGKLGMALAGVIAVVVVVSLLPDSDQTAEDHTADLNTQPAGESPVGVADDAVTTGDSPDDFPAASSLSTFEVDGLTWTTDDRGEDVDWYAASAHCEDLMAERRSDWRLPTIEELESIYDPSDVNAFGHKIMRPFHDGVTSNWIWSSTEDTSGAAFAFDFNDGSETSLAVNFDEGAHGLCVSDSAPP